MSNEGLITAMEHALETAEAPFDRRLLETGIWYYKNAQRIPEENLKGRLELQEKTNEIVLEMFAMVLERIRKAEGRSNVLFTPKGLDIKF
jgi:hypothetical protein